MGKRNNRVLSAAVFGFFGLFASEPNHDQVHISCHSMNLAGETAWDRALAPNHEELLVNGFWIKDHEGDSVFLLDNITPAMLTEYCTNTVNKSRNQQADEYHLTGIRAVKFPWPKSYRVKFTTDNKAEAFQQIHRNLHELINQKFLDFAHGELESRRNPKLIASLLYQYIQHHPQCRKNLISHVKAADNYASTSKTPIQWKSEKWLERVTEFVSKYRDETDFSIITYTMLGGQGSENVDIGRGSMNSFVDLATSSFVPRDEKGDAPFPNIFQPENPDHQKTLAYVRAFSALAALRGFTAKVPHLIQSSNLEEFDSTFNVYMDLVNKVSELLNALEEHTPSPQSLHKLRVIENKISNLFWPLIQEPFPLFDSQPQ